jgi:hypothetical protein
LRLPIGVVVPAGGAALPSSAAMPGTESLGRAR